MNGRVTPDGRGFTIDKSLAWTISTALLIGGIWLGSEVLGTKRVVQDLSAGLASQADDRAQYRRDTDARLRSLETDRAADSRDLANALNLLTRIDQRLERIEQRTSTP